METTTEKSTAVATRIEKDRNVQPAPAGDVGPRSGAA